MGVTVKFYRKAWWLFINHRGRRRSKCVGDHATALEAARKVRRHLVEGDLSVLDSDAGETFDKYAETWLANGEGGRKASTHRFYDFNLRLHILAGARDPSDQGGVAR